MEIGNRGGAGTMGSDWRFLCVAGSQAQVLLDGDCQVGRRGKGSREPGCPDPPCSRATGGAVLHPCCFPVVVPAGSLGLCSAARSALRTCLRVSLVAIF